MTKCNLTRVFYLFTYMLRRIYTRAHVCTVQAVHLANLFLHTYDVYILYNAYDPITSKWNGIIYCPAVFLRVFPLCTYTHTFLFLHAHTHDSGDHATYSHGKLNGITTSVRRVQFNASIITSARASPRIKSQFCRPCGIGTFATLHTAY